MDLELGKKQWGVIVVGMLVWGLLAIWGKLAGEPDCGTLTFGRPPCEYVPILGSFYELSHAGLAGLTGIVLIILFAIAYFFVPKE